jgi:CRISPR-associated protein Cmr1
MIQIHFNCEIITPMFLAGADTGQPELRPPSIKGAMRFWWRAVQRFTSPDDLKRRDA